jgi:hypothetical protein
VERLVLLKLNVCAALALLVCAVGCPGPSGGEGEGEGGAGEGEGAAGEGEGAGCASDPVLGSLVVGDNWIVAGDQGISSDINTVGISVQGGTSEIFGLTFDLHVVDVGVFPGGTTLIPPVVFDAVSAADQGLARGTDDFGSFLVVDGPFLAAGYARASDHGGSVAGVDNASAAAPTLVDAPSNFAGARRGDVLLLESAGAGDDTDGLGVFAFAGEPSTWTAATPTTFATLGASAVGSGNIAATAGGIVVFGRFSSSNDLYAVSSASADAILAGGAAIDAEGETPFLSTGLNGSGQAMVDFGEGVVFATADSTFTQFAVQHVDLTDNGADVSASAVDDVVTGGSPACTSINFVAHSNIAEELLIGVSDAAGSRLVQVRHK